MINKILVVRNDRFGEFILNIPAFRALKETFKYAKISLVVNPYVKELAECITYIDEVIIWENRKHRFFEVLKFSQILKKEKFNLCVVLNPSKEFNIISFLAGIPIRVGYARKWDFLLTHKIEDKKYLGLRHEVEYNLELVELIGATTEDYSLSLGIQDSNLFDEFKDSIAVHPYTSDPIKQWPINNFLELIKKISQLNERVVIVGGKENLQISKELFYNLSKNIKDMTGKTSLVELGLLLKKCKLLVSGDSGPVHMASAVGTPVIAIFRNDIPAKSPKRWGPWGKGHIVVEKPSLSEITVEEIFSKIKDKLGASSPNTSRNGPRLG